MRDKATRQHPLISDRSIAEEKPDFEHDVPHPVVSTKQVRPPPTVPWAHHPPISSSYLVIGAQVESFLSTLVNETAIAELQLQVGGSRWTVPCA